MANGIFSGFNPFVPKEDKQGADQYISETRFGELPPVGQTFGEGQMRQPSFAQPMPGDEPVGIGEQDQMQAGLTGDDAVLPIIGTGVVGAGAAKLADEALRKEQIRLFNERYRGSGGRFTKGARPVTRLDVLKNLGSRLGALRGASGMAGIMNPYTATASALLTAEEAPKLFGSDKSTSEILTELAATSPEERAGAAEYAALGANLPGLGTKKNTAPQVPQELMGLRTDPQGRMIPAGFKTRAEAFPEYERQAAAREARLEAQPDSGEAQPVESRRRAAETGIPTDAELRDLAQARMPGASEGEIARGMEIASRYGIDPLTGKPKPTKIEQDIEKARYDLLQAQLEQANIRPTTTEEVNGVLYQLYSDGSRVPKFLLPRDPLSDTDLDAFVSGDEVTSITKADYEKLKKGDKFIYEGKEYIKQ